MGRDIAAAGRGVEAPASVNAYLRGVDIRWNGFDLDGINPAVDTGANASRYLIDRIARAGHRQWSPARSASRAVNRRDRLTQIGKGGSDAA